jgi:hypothetical protein
VVGISNEGPHSQQNTTAEVGIAAHFAAVIGDFATAGALPDTLPECESADRRRSGSAFVRFQLSKPCKLVLKVDLARRIYHPHLTPICRDFYELALREEPLAMQKVEGSSPLSRSS